MAIRSAVLAAALVFALYVSAQETRSMIYGRVLDPQAAALTGAKVTVTNTGTNTSDPGPGFGLLETNSARRRVRTCPLA